MRQKSKWVKFMERERKFKQREEDELHNNIRKSVNDKIYTTVQSESVIKKEESKCKLNQSDNENDGENHQRLSWVGDNREQRKR